MSIIKCKMCGGDIELSADKTFGMCEYCGSTTTLPKINDEQRAAAFNRGNGFRRAGEFDKALAVYERIVQEDNTDAEAHWCCALCRFGIEYVEDPTTFEYIPTCHRASFDSFLSDVDYLAAVEHSFGITKRQYQKDGAKIAEVQKGILATSQNEEPFDVFICYKESDDNGNRTKDSTLAQDIYYQLAEKGYRVFFSKITLENKAGTQYEPYIFAALNSAKVMIVIGTTPEHFNAVWVKNEWSRFLSLMKHDRSKLLLPCYRDMDPYDLPEALSILQSYDMSKIGFVQDLLWGIQKILTKDTQETAPAAMPRAAASDHTSAVGLGFMDLEMGKKESAEAIFRNVLQEDITCAEAYLGLMTLGGQAEWEFYGTKFIQYAPVMTETERQFITSKNAQQILKVYIFLADSERIKYILEHFPELNSDGKLSVYAVENASLFLMKLLLEQGIDANFVRKGETNEGIYYEEPLLCYAVYKTKSEEMVRLLLEHGADPNSYRLHRDKNGDQWYSALSDSIWNVKSVEMARILIEAGADVNRVEKLQFDTYYTELFVLFYAAYSGSPEMVQLLLEHGADPNSCRLLRDKNGDKWYSVLSDSIWSAKSVEMARILIEAGADVNRVEKTQYDASYEETSMLSYAVIHSGSPEMVRLLLEHGADPNITRLYKTQKGTDYYSPLSDSIRNVKNPEMVRILIEYGADVNRIETINTTVPPARKSMLFYAIVDAQSVEMIQMLIKAGASMNDTVVYNGKKARIRKFPFHGMIPGAVFEELKKNGWVQPIFY